MRVTDEPFLVGSPPSESERRAVTEPLRPVTIHHSFALATHETTTREFRSLINNHQPNERYSQLEDGPAVAVSWYRAAEYCNRLSDKERIPRAQWCYEPNEDGHYASGMRLKSDFLERTGYRLPTDVEWEYAACAGSTVARHFGQPDDLLSRYEWHLLNTLLMSRTTGSLRPNDLGLFDVLGNAFEWTNDRPLSLSSEGLAKNDHVVIDTAQRVFRGGSFGSPPALARSAARIAQFPNQRMDTYGFRLARTIRESPTTKR